MANPNDPNNPNYPSNYPNNPNHPNADPNQRSNPNNDPNDRSNPNNNQNNNDPNTYDAWAAGQSYAEGKRVRDAGKGWECMVAHTSGNGGMSADRTAHPDYWRSTP